MSKHDRTQKSSKIKYCSLNVSESTYDLITEKARECGISRSEMIKAVFEFVGKKKLKIKCVPAKTEIEFL